MSIDMVSSDPMLNSVERVEIMNVIIFGATGSVGRHLVEQAIAERHNVTAFVRNPAALDQKAGSLQLMKGDVFDADSVAAAIAGQDAVFCALGAGRKAGVRAQGTANIIRGMQRHGVKRLVCQTTLGAGDSAPTLSFYWKHIMFGLLLRAMFADHQLQERHIMESDLDWTIVRPAAFTDGPATKTFRHGFPAFAKGLALKISRVDVAAFMLRQLSDVTYLRKAPGLSY